MALGTATVTVVEIVEKLETVGDVVVDDVNAALTVDDNDENLVKSWVTVGTGDVPTVKVGTEDEVDEELTEFVFVFPIDDKEVAVCVTTDERVEVDEDDTRKLFDASDVLVAEYCVPTPENVDSIEVEGETVTLFTVPIEEAETVLVVFAVALSDDDADGDLDNISEPLTLIECEVKTLKLGDPSQS